MKALSVHNWKELGLEERKPVALRGRIQKGRGGCRCRRAVWSGPMAALSPLPSQSLEMVSGEQ